MSFKDTEPSQENIYEYDAYQTLSKIDRRVLLWIKIIKKIYKYIFLFYQNTWKKNCRLLRNSHNSKLNWTSPIFGHYKSTARKNKYDFRYL